jgi:hypothetical protein
MPVPRLRFDHPTFRRLLLTTALGAVSGFQFWRLAIGFVPAIPWYGLAWIPLSFALLGLSIGITAPFARWWKRGLVMGLACSLPTAAGALVLGLRPMPYLVIPLAGGLSTGVLIAWLSDVMFAQRPVVSELAVPVYPRPEFLPEGPVHQRLEEGKQRLEEIEAERQKRRDREFDREEEERIIWGELLDLELQDIDEQIRRIRNARS